MFLIRFRWPSVDGRKRCKNASVDEKLFIRFQETENGGFRKRISVDRALINYQTLQPIKMLLADTCNASSFVRFDWPARTKHKLVRRVQ